MNKRDLRKLAESKGLGFMITQGMFWFIFPGQNKAYAATKELIEQVQSMYVPETRSQAPAGAVLLEGLSQEERDVKVLEMVKQSHNMEKGE